MGANSGKYLEALLQFVKDSWHSINSGVSFPDSEQWQIADYECNSNSNWRTWLWCFFVVCIQIAYQMILIWFYPMGILNKKGVLLKRQLKEKKTILIIDESYNKIKILVYIYFII